MRYWHSTFPKRHSNNFCLSKFGYFAYHAPKIADISMKFVSPRNRNEIPMHTGYIENIAFYIISVHRNYVMSSNHSKRIPT